MTLRKIDEIEAQMSKQWWKGRQDEASVQDSSFPVAAGVPRANADRTPPGHSSKEGPGTFSPTQASELRSDSDLVQVDYDSTQMGAVASVDPMLATAPQSMMAFKKSESRSFDSSISEFSASRLLSVELGDSQADPELEEAAIRFANGDEIFKLAQTEPQRHDTIPVRASEPAPATRLNEPRDNGFPAGRAIGGKPRLGAVCRTA